MSKRGFIFILIIALCFSMACIDSNNVLTVFLRSQETTMISKSYADIETLYGSPIYCEIDNDCLLCYFEKSDIGFYFFAEDLVNAVTTADGSEQRFKIPVPVVLRTISPNETCIGVTGRIKDFGVTNGELVRKAYRKQDPHQTGQGIFYVLEADNFLLTFQADGSADNDGMNDIVSVVQKNYNLIDMNNQKVEDDSFSELNNHDLEIKNEDIENLEENNGHEANGDKAVDQLSIYQQAQSLYESGLYGDAILLFEGLSGYLDSDLYLSWCESEISYARALELFAQADYDGSLTIFSSLNDFRDSQVYAIKSRLQLSKVGETISFGRYPQGNSSGTLDDLEWVVLSRNDSRMLIISKHIIDAKPYNMNHPYRDELNLKTPITWADCTLRDWLNIDFFSIAFNSYEKSVVLDTTVHAERNRWYGISGGMDTVDKIFLLSISEITEYWPNIISRRAEKTQYAIDNSENLGSSNWWWLRNPGMYVDCAAIVKSDGGYSETKGDWIGRGVHYPGGVRPVLWVDLS